MHKKHQFITAAPQCAPLRPAIQSSRQGFRLKGPTAVCFKLLVELAAVLHSFDFGQLINYEGKYKINRQGTGSKFISMSNKARYCCGRVSQIVHRVKFTLSIFFFGSLYCPSHVVYTWKVPHCRHVMTLSLHYGYFGVEGRLLAAA